MKEMTLDYDWINDFEALFTSIGKVLTEGQLKLDKSQDQGYLSAGFNLSPARESVPFGGIDMCPGKGACEIPCLKGSGMNQMTTHELARIRKTLLFARYFPAFRKKALKEVAALIRKAARRELIPAVRPNLLSDQPKLAKMLQEEFPDLQLYDYTKLRRPWERTNDKYHLTFSLDVGEASELHALKCIEHEVNVAVVIDHPKDDPVPDTFTLRDVTLPTIDGDKHDLRFLDPWPRFVMLRGKKIKGKKHVDARESGFYRRAA